MSEQSWICESCPIDVDGDGDRGGVRSICFLLVLGNNCICHLHLLVLALIAQLGVAPV